MEELIKKLVENGYKPNAIDTYKKNIKKYNEDSIDIHYDVSNLGIIILIIKEYISITTIIPTFDINKLNIKNIELFANNVYQSYTT